MRSIAGSSAPTMTSRLRGLAAVTTGENTDTATVASTSGVACANRTTMSEAIECPSTASRPSLSGSLRAHAATSVSSASNAAVIVLALGDVAAHRRRIAAVSEKIEGHRNIAIARQRFREGLHQLL